MQSQSGPSYIATMPAAGRLPRLHDDSARSEQFSRAAITHAAFFAATLTFASFYLVTGLLGVWAAYDGRTALLTYLQIVIGVAPVFVLPLLAPNVAPVSAARAFALLGVIALYIVALLVIAQGTIAARQVALPGALSGRLPSIDAAANLAALLILPALAAIVQSLRKSQWGFALVTLGAVVLGLWAVAISGSIDTWTGVIGGIGAATFLYWRLGRRRVTSFIRVIDLAILFAIVAALVGYVALIFVVPPRQLAALPQIGATLVDRVSYWRDTLPVAEDYWNTGAGLGALPMVLSTYAFLVHVPFLHEVHNLYLEVLLEQGAFGLVSFIGMFVATIAGAICAWRIAERSVRILMAGWVAAVVMAVTHGLLESELYASTLRFASLLFLSILGYLAWLVVRNLKSKDPRMQGAHIRGIAAAAIVILLPVTTQLFYPTWHSNLGAVLETKSLLAEYTNGKWMTQDLVLRERPDLFVESERRLHQALEADPGSATANRRLGQIAMSRGEYDAAYDYFMKALNSPIESRMTLQYLGELYALKNNPAQAASIWAMKNNKQGQLLEREWWYQFVVDDEAQSKRIATAIQTYRDEAPSEEAPSGEAEGK